MDKLKEKRRYINIRKYTVLCDLTKIDSFLLFFIQKHIPGIWKGYRLTPTLTTSQLSLKVHTRLFTGYFLEKWDNKDPTQCPEQ